MPPDKLDYVTDLTQTFNDTALAEHRRSNAPSELESAEDCVNCGDQISRARQLAAPGCQLCTGCQSFMERTGRLP